jgi:DNA-binding NtrC family response regulator
MARVLVVEDDTSTLEVLSTILESEAYEVTTTAQLSSGVALLEREPFDLVLTDLFAPVFSPDALRDLRAYTAAAPETPIVVTTAHAQAADYDPAAYGLAAVLLKPFDLEELLTCVRGVLATQEERLRSLRATAERAWEHHRSAEEHIGDSSELLRRVHDPPPPAAES